MGRMTYGEIIQQSIDICIDDQSVSYTGMSDPLTFIKREINNAVSDIFTLMKEYRLQPTPKIVATKSGYTYYSNPPGLMKPESFTIALGTHTPPLEIVQSQQQWNRYQQLPITSGFPTKVFPRRDDFGIYPTPDNIYNITIVGSYQPTRMNVADFTDGVVKVTNDSTELVITGGTFTESMVGRWFSLTDSTSLESNGNWYRISGYTSSTKLQLSRTFTEDTKQGQTFVIAESPEIPDELHQFIAYKVGSVYWNVRKQDSKRSQELANYFYTGDLNNSNRTGSIQGGILATLRDMKTNGRGNSNLIEMYADDSEDYLTNTIWGTELS